MQLLILTHGRPDSQPTYDALKAAGLEPLCVASDPASIPSGGRAHIMRRTSHVGEARRAALGYGAKYDTRVVLMDDDLKFFQRVEDNRFARTYDVTELFELIDSELDNFAHVGVTQRFMANYTKPGGELNRRYIKLAAYNLSMIPKRIDFRLRVHEDIDAQLQLAAQGLDAKIITDYAVDDNGQYKPGGCQRYRTPEVEAAEFAKLAKHHPRFVSFVNGRSRVAWARAYREGKQ